MNRYLARWAAIAAACVTMGMLGMSTAQASTSTSLPDAAFNRTTLNYYSSLSTSSEANRYQVMVLQSTAANEVRALHAANPNLRILMYSNVLYSRSSDPNGIGTCTGYSADNANDPSWFLTDQSGGRIIRNGGSLMDMGNAAYQKACVTHATALAKQDGFDGVLLDGINAVLASVLPSGTQVAAYPTTSAWDDAITSFVNYAGPAVQAAGLIAVGNLTGTSEAQWEQWTGPLNGSEEQGWIDGGQGIAQQIPYWASKLAKVSWSEAHDKLTILNSYNRTESGNAYGLASMLLVSDGNTSYSTSNSGSGSYEAWYPEYTAAQQLGTPTGGYIQLPDGAYERKFTNGIVLVNPTQTAMSSFPLSGTYRNGATELASTGLAPTSGMILLNGNSPVQFNRTAYEYRADGSSNPADYQFLILTSFASNRIAALKAVNPNLKVLMYSMALYSNINDAGAQETCTSYSTDNSQDPSWFLPDQNGHRMYARGGNDYAMDLGNGGYQHACVANTIALAKQDGFDGVFFDGINSTWRGFVPSGSTVPKYPTDSAWQNAMQSFLNYAGSALQANDLMSFANLGGASPTLWSQWTTPLTGSQEQGFTDGGYGLAQQVPSFAHKLANIAWSEAHAKYAIEDSYNQTEAGNTYGLASMLLVSNGYASWSTSNTDDTASGDWWYPEYNDAEQLGAPTGPYTRLSNGVYTRSFENGIVLSNPSNSLVPAFSLGGTYHGSEQASTSTVSMPATSGLILLKTS